MRYLTAFFSAVPQVTGLYVVSDIFPFHMQARKVRYRPVRVGFHLVTQFITSAKYVGHGIHHLPVSVSVRVRISSP